MPVIRERLLERFGLARLPMLENGERIIAEGAAWIASDDLRLRLAKPVEVLTANNSYAPVIGRGLVLPREGEVHRSVISMYCIDPRDAVAKFQLARPKLPRDASPADPRQIYRILTVEVDETAQPFLERLELAIEIDDNLILNARVLSTLRGHTVEEAVYDLEFGLGLGSDGSGNTGSATEDASGGGPQGTMRTVSLGAVQLRSNITWREEEWDLVPGEIVEKYRPHHLDSRLRTNPRQISEKMYYVPCSVCKRNIYEINRNGCNEISCARSRS